MANQTEGKHFETGYAALQENEQLTGRQAEKKYNSTVFGNADSDHGHDHNGHDHGATGADGWRSHWNLLTALAILVLMQILEYGFQIKFNNPIELLIYIPAYLLAGYKVLDFAWRKVKRLNFFTSSF